MRFIFSPNKAEFPPVDHKNTGVAWPRHLWERIYRTSARCRLDVLLGIELFQGKQVFGVETPVFDPFGAVSRLI
jgi:hypothetical protein